MKCEMTVGLLFKHIYSRQDGNQNNERSAILEYLLAQKRATLAVVYLCGHSVELVPYNINGQRRYRTGLLQKFSYRTGVVARTKSDRLGRKPCETWRDPYRSLSLSLLCPGDIYSGKQQKYTYDCESLVQWRNDLICYTDPVRQQQQPLNGPGSLFSQLFF